MEWVGTHSNSCLLTKFRYRGCAQTNTKHVASPNHGPKRKYNVWSFPSAFSPSSCVRAAQRVDRRTLSRPIPPPNFVSIVWRAVHSNSIVYTVLYALYFVFYNMSAPSPLAWCRLCLCALARSLGSWSLRVQSQGIRDHPHLHRVRELL